MNSFFIETYGCQMNMAESNALENLLTENGFEKQDKPENADYVIINTCSVRQSAENRIWGRLGFYRHMKSIRPQVLILTGCMAQRLLDSVKKDAPQIDFVVPVNDKLKIVQILKNETLMTQENYCFSSNYYHEGDFASYVPIMNGCNNFCSYCIVPYVRGREVSRSPEEIFTEVTALDEKGVKEITLLGQNVNSYDYNGKTFPSLLEEICLLPMKNIKWIRFESPHPKDFSDELISVIAKEEKVAKHLHIPLQSGSSRILKLMNRNYTREQFLNLIDKIKKTVPNVTFSVDVMVGFPSETEEDFLQTEDLMKEVGFIDAYMYYWNPREGTRAVKMDGQLSDAIKSERLSKLIDFQLKNVASLKMERANGVQDILVLQISRDDSAQMLGRNEHGEMVAFKPLDSVEIGTFVKVKFLGLNGNTYTGEQVI